MDMVKSLVKSLKEIPNANISGRNKEGFVIDLSAKKLLASAQGQSAHKGPSGNVSALPTVPNIYQLFNSIRSPGTIFETD